VRSRSSSRCAEALKRRRLIYPETNMEMSCLETLQPNLVVVDLYAVYLDDISGAPGSISQTVSVPCAWARSRVPVLFWPCNQTGP
jgi:predicted ATP-dependent serine protease